MQKDSAMATFGAPVLVLSRLNTMIMKNSHFTCCRFQYKAGKWQESSVGEH